VPDLTGGQGGSFANLRIHQRADPLQTERLVLQRTERPWVLASDSIKTMRRGIKGARVRDLDFYCHAIPACMEKGRF